MAKKTTSRSSTKTKVTKAKVTQVAKVAKPRAATADVDELDAILAESERENQTLISVLEQAQRAQRSLATAQKRIKDLETRHEAEYQRETKALSSERDAAQAAAQAAEQERKAATAALRDSAKAARSLAASILRVGDPLEPLADGDADKELTALRATVKELASHKGEDDPDHISETIAQVKELVDLISGRVSQQSNRVKLLRKHVHQLEGDIGKAGKEADSLRKTIATTEKNLTGATKELTGARATIGSLEKSVEQTAAKLERQTRVTLDSEAKALRERERLTQEHTNAAHRADGLSKDLVDVRTQLRQAERLAADLGQLLIDTCDEMVKVEGAEGPSTDLAKRELAELVDALSDAADDDLEAAFREDVCEDLLPSGRALSVVLTKRHRSFGAALAAARKREETVSAKAARLSEHLDTEKSSHKAAKQELTRSEAQLKAAGKELDRLGKELNERVSDLSTTKGEVARIAAENEGLARQVEAARLVKAELDTIRSELSHATKDLESQRTDAEQWTVGLKNLARALVELASATESALVSAGLKPEGFIGRFTRSMRKLESDVGSGDDVAAMLKSSLDMAEKAASRIAQLERELRLRGETLAAAERDRDANAKALAAASSERDAKAHRVVELETEHETLGREAARARELDVTLATRNAELDTVRREHSELSSALKQTRAEVEEVKAREAATVDSLHRDLDQTRKRLSDEQTVHRDHEADAADAREELEAKAATLQARATELEKALESREQRIAALSKEVGTAADRAAKASEEKKKADQLKARLSKADERIKALEAELEEAQGLADAADEADALRGERDDLASRLRAAEKRAADASGTAARATTTAESLKRKLDERQTSYRGEVDTLQERVDTLGEENRRLKEQLAGLNARVRTLTDA
jgi:chromosome segregation ATPase